MLCDIQVVLMFGPEYARSCGTAALEPLGVYLPGTQNYPGMLHFNSSWYSGMRSAASLVMTWILMVCSYSPKLPDPMHLGIALGADVPDA